LSTSKKAFSSAGRQTSLFPLLAQMIHIEQIRPELTWRLRREALYPAGEIADMAMDTDSQGIHFGAFTDNKLVGVVSVFQHGDILQFRKFAVDQAYQNMGVGTALLNYTIEFATENGGIRLWCNARLNAVGFYLKNGFAQTGLLFSKNGYDYAIVEKSLVLKKPASLT